MNTNPYPIERCDDRIYEDMYSFIWPQDWIDKVNKLMGSGYNQKDACQKVLTQFRAEESQQNSAVREFRDSDSQGIGV